jgi:hypothetical protein
MPSQIVRVFSRLRIMLFASTALVAACGGGGGSSSGGTGNGGNPTAVDSIVALSQTTIGTTAYVGGYSPDPQSVNIQITGSRTVYLDVGSSGPAVASATLTIIDAAAGTARVDIQFSPTNGATPGGTSMAVGDNPGTVTVISCYDAQCASPLPGSPQVIQVTYTLKQFVGTSTLNFNAMEGGAAPPTQSLSFGLDGPIGQSWTTGVQYLSGSNWMTLSKSSGSSLPDSIDVSVAVLPPGTYQCWLAIATQGATPITSSIFVTYIVSPLLSVPAQIEFNLTPSSTASDLARAVNFQAGATPFSWTATSSETWLTITPASGDSTSTTQFTVALNPAKAIPMGKPAAETKIVLTPSDPAIAPAEIPVWLHGTLPVVYSVNPSALTSNSANEPVIIRGSNLDSASVSGRTLMAGSAAVPSFSSTGATEVDASFPALASGQYLVYFENQLGLKLTWSVLDVNVSTYGYAAVSAPGSMSKLIYSPHQAAVYALDTANGKVNRFGYNAGNSSWSLQSRIFSGPGTGQLRDMAIAPTAQNLVVLDDQQLYELDLASLATLRTRQRPIDVYTRYRFHQIAFGSAGNAILTTASALDEATGYYSFLDQTKTITGPYGGFYKGVLATSGNGRRIVIGEDGDPAWANINHLTSLGSGDSMIYTNVSMQMLAASVDRFGTNSVLQQRAVPAFGVYDAAFSLLGSLPATTSAAVIRPDGLRAYAYEAGSQSIRVFDVASGFQEIGSAAALADSPGANPAMAISPDGHTLFIGGSANLLVVPAP